ncbi:MAG: UDP-N-acetylmuramoyl-L-alanine--D-glutamate ligase [Gemmatimonadota bacterium]|nr:UDP-N-acetylmuramoyl-L-alanine--D-glutamate ligase [Gemmatimonadota bacterium]
MLPFERGDRVAVLGLGASGVAAARLASALGARVYASDASAASGPREAASVLGAEGIDAEAGGHDLAKILDSRLVVTSPGIDPATEVRSAVTAAGIRTIAEVELAYRRLSSRVIAITGTNGKTTATALCGHVLEQAGVSALTAGNIGRPLSEVALLERQPDWVVVELSSFQLADLDQFASAIGVLLNLAPDHLDRYANLERYYADKARLFANATDESLWVLNGDDAAVLDLAKGVPGRRHLTYAAAPRPGEDEGAVAGRAFVDAGGWLVCDLGGEVERWVRTNDLRLIGRHNWSNALLAGVAARLAGCSAADVGRGLASFEGLPHRLRSVREIDGVMWVNDSKATNISATRVALEAFDRPLVVLLGGRHKGEPYTSLLPAVAGARAVVAYGESAPIIVRELGPHVELEVANGFEEAMRKARGLARAGDVVLLSPACSSYDMFPSYAVRGDTFEEHVHAMRPEGAE